MTEPIRVVGLGPAGLDRLPAEVVAVLTDSGSTVVVRTLHHPAAADLADRRQVVTCDDLYDDSDTFDTVYEEIVERVLGIEGSVIYAVPGSPLVGERSVRLLRERTEVDVLHAESFLDVALDRLGLDPVERGLQVLDAHELPEPLLLHLPTLIGQVDTSGALHAVRDGLLSLLPADSPVTLLTDLGAPSESVHEMALKALRGEHAGLRVTIFVDAEPPGWPGLVRVNALLRRECPWDREQTHHTLASHLLEEAYEALQAIDALPSEAPGGDTDVPAYVELEEELGDLLLQVVFHATLASEAGVFGIEEVAERIRRKLIARHPHVFGDVDAESADRVRSNWEQIKQEEKGRDSVLDGVVRSQPSLARSRGLQSRAARVGFDWPDLVGVEAKVREELAEVLAEDADHHHEVGDLLFAVVNLARHLGVDPEQALRLASDRFERRFRLVEQSGDLRQMTLEEMDTAWERAKHEEGSA